MWSNRLLAESKSWKYTYFITLTYNDVEILNVDYKRPMRDFQLFMKRLRKKFNGLRFKYFATSELGGETLRFHYHCILFSQEHIFADMIFFKKFNNTILYRSSLLTQKLWKKGHCAIAWAEQNSMRYTANYIQKENNNLSHCMSKGLGTDYILQNDVKKIGLYLVHGKYSVVPRSIKKKDLKAYIKPNLNDLRDFDYLLHGDIIKYEKDREQILKKQLYIKKT